MGRAVWYLCACLEAGAARPGLFPRPTLNADVAAALRFLTRLCLPSRAVRGLFLGLEPFPTSLSLLSSTAHHLSGKSEESISNTPHHHLSPAQRKRTGRRWVRKPRIITDGSATEGCFVLQFLTYLHDCDYTSTGKRLIRKS